jgi:hypothetical protein
VLLTDFPAAGRGTARVAAPAPGGGMLCAFAALQGAAAPPGAPLGLGGLGTCEVQEECSPEQLAELMQELKRGGGGGSGSSSSSGGCGGSGRAGEWGSSSGAAPGSSSGSASGRSGGGSGSSSGGAGASQEDGPAAVAAALDRRRAAAVTLALHAERDAELRASLVAEGLMAEVAEMLEVGLPWPGGAGAGGRVPGISCVALNGAPHACRAPLRRLTP